MKKKQYIIPIVEMEIWNMQDVMIIPGASPEKPDDPGTLKPAPARNIVF